MAFISSLLTLNDCNANLKAVPYGSTYAISNPFLFDPDKY